MPWVSIIGVTLGPQVQNRCRRGPEHVAMDQQPNTLLFKAATTGRSTNGGHDGFAAIAADHADVSKPAPTEAPPARWHQRSAERWSSSSPLETLPFIGLVCSSIFAFALFNGTQPVIGVKDCARVGVAVNNTETTLTTNRTDLITSTTLLPMANLLDDNGY